MCVSISKIVVLLYQINLSGFFIIILKSVHGNNKNDRNPVKYND